MAKFNLLAPAQDGLGILARLAKHAAESVTTTPETSLDNVVQATTATAVPMVIKRASSGATADLLQIQDETGSVLSGFSSSGSVLGGSLPFTYGVTTDGVTVTVKDKTLATISSGTDLGALLTALDADNATFMLGQGSFPCSTRIGFVHANVAIIGVNPAATVIASTSDASGSNNDAVLKYRTGSTFGYLANVTVTTSAIAGGATFHGVAFSDADSICENVIVTCSSTTTDGISVQSGATRMRVRRCIVSGAKTAGIDSSADDVSIEHNNVTSCGDGSSGTQAGINVGSGQRVRIRFNRCNTNGVNGIRYASTGAEGPEISFNTCKANGALGTASFDCRGIGVTSASGNDNTRIIGNRCIGNYECGIVVNPGSAASCNVVGNYSAGNNVGVRAGGHGIEMDCPGTISGNVCTGNNNGISITSNHVNITGNQCFSNSGSQGNGIAVNGVAGTITGNSCYSNGNDGIKLFSTTSHAGITGNVCHSNTGYGIEYSATVTPGSRVTGNDCYSNTAGNYSLTAQAITTVGRREIVAKAHGLITEPFSRLTCGSSTVVVSGTAYGIEVGLRAGDVVTGVQLWTNVALAVGGASGLLFKVGLWDSAGTLLASSPDLSGNAQLTNGARIFHAAFSSSYAVPADGQYFAGFIYYAGTGGAPTAPQFLRNQSGVTGAVSAGSTGIATAWAASGLTDIGTVTPTATNTITFWVAPEGTAAG